MNGSAHMERKDTLIQELSVLISGMAVAGIKIGCKT